MSPPTLPGAGDGFLHAEDLLTRAEASARLAAFKIQMKPATLARVFCVGGDGPPCIHIRGKPHYPRDALEAWALGQRTAPRQSARDDPTGGAKP